MVQSLKYCFKSKLFWLYVLIAFAAFTKQIFSESLLIDSFEYSKKASFIFQNWSTTNVPMDRFLEPMRRTIGYPLLIKAMFFNHLAIYFFQLILSICVPVILHKFCERFLYFNNLWQVSMIVLLTYPLQFFYTAFLMPDLLCQFLLLLLVYAYFEGHWKTFPLILTALILLKPVFIVFLLVPLVLVALKQYTMSLVDGFPFMIVLIISCVNYQQYGLFTYSSVGTTNAYDYNRKKTLLTDLDANQVDEMYATENRQLNQFKHDFKYQKEFMNSKTIPLLVNAKYWAIHLKGMAITLIDPGRYDAMVFLNWNKSSGFMGVNDGNEKKVLPWWQLLYILILLSFSIFKLLFAVYATFHWKRYKTIIYLGVMILLLAFIAGPVGSARYLLPVYPLMAFLSGLGCLTYLKNHPKIESFITQR